MSGTWRQVGPRASTLTMALLKLSTDSSSVEFITPSFHPHPKLCEPICLNQATQIVLLSEMSTMDDIVLAALLVGDLSRGVVHFRDSRCQHWEEHQ
jgi:hypothetical protein